MRSAYTDWRVRRAFRDARPHYVYSLFDSEGLPVYVGMSLDVAKRIKQHHATLDPHRTYHKPPAATWLLDVRTVKVIGPYAHPEAVRVEKDLIGRLQPRANVQYTVRDNRPAIARRSAELARLEVSA